LERAREGEPEALAEIYDRYSLPIYRYLFRILGDAALAEDLTSDVFLRLLQVLNTLRAPRDRLEGWLFWVAHNLAMDWFRRHKRSATQPLAEELIAGGEQPPAAVERKQAEQQLRAAVGRLTPDQQRVILLRFGEGFSLAEVAQLMNKSEGAVKTLQHRAVSRLRKVVGVE